MLDLKNTFYYFIFLKLIYYLCLFSVFISYVTCDDSSPKVTMGDTEIVGVLKKKSGFVYEEFLGIPYAKAPVGSLRFKEPETYTITENPFQATQYRDQCIQYPHSTDNKIQGSEDCLYLNIYRPILVADSTPYNVIVFIHGGAFMFGKPSYSARLVKRGFLFVSFSYRLGPIGFMSTGDAALPGNLGLKDQVAALKWVKDNIAFFNGNPDSVTLSGLSAGGASVHLHLLSPLSKNLFNRVITSSGSALNPWVLAKAVPEKTRIVATALNCSTHDSYAMVECLRSRKAVDIVAQVPKFLKFLYVPFTPFGPVIESSASTRSSAPFLSGHPYDLLQKREVTKVPIIMGMVTGEGLYPVAEFANDQNILQQLDAEWVDMASYLLDCHFTLDDDCLQKTMKDAREVYLQQKTVPDAVAGLVKMVGDRLFGSGIAVSALMYAAISDSPVYMYRFGYSSSKSLSKLLHLEKSKQYGVAHGEDFLFYILDVKGFDLESEDDHKMSNVMLDLWENFASSRVPEFGDHQFMPDARNSLPVLKYLEINSSTSIHEASTGNMSNMLFWRPLMLKEKTAYIKMPSTGSVARLQGGFCCKLLTYSVLLTGISVVSLWYYFSG